MWSELLLALVAFLAAHRVPARLKGPLVAVLGRRGVGLVYGLLSLGLLYWLIVASARAPFLPLWDLGAWARWLVNLAMPLAVLAAVCGGMGGLMAGFALWSGAHLLANGDLAHVLFFASMLAYAGFGLTRAPPRRWRLGWPRMAAALLIWAALIRLHPLVIGVAPLP
ncbi:MAG: NnrU family protein [Paracoccus sp. (in: a-proteobacteria)]|uniref:NnrU family protein n=1 Tax=Paracoccus sp. TaxID=267 RepID=UPI0039E62CD0